ncbi:DNA-directed RNA polymerase [Macleaya cordata]|uniref:DNA-directed RNA polymerase subunit beta n=1 Tax=Macleaya cordata TaxID=56857 RepID=A0A200PUS9_MACCD|nr:DNA-directed RNA polymerase [Macleaya cordata]
MGEDSWTSDSDNDPLPNVDDMEVDLSTLVDSPEKLDAFASGKNPSKASTSTTEEELSLSEEFLNKFCREASMSFFNEFGLISHQINSYNEFIENGIQKLFDSIAEITVEPGYDPSKKGEGEWRYASVSFGKVTLDRPTFWTGEKFSADNKKEYLNLLPRHARLQNMTYSSRMKVEINVQVYTRNLIKSDKFKSGKEQFVQKEVQSEDKRDIVIGRIPVMVRSNLCWMNDLDKNDCDFDHGGYFLIKGAEKAFIAQEQICLKRLWVSDKPNWTVSYRSEMKRRRVFIKLVEASTGEDQYFYGGKVLSVYFMSCTIPLWIMFFALGMSSDKEIVDMIDVDMKDARCVNILLATIHNADSLHKAFSKEGEALKCMDELIKSSKFPPTESIKDIIDKYLFPNLNGPKQKAVFLGYMVKCLLLSYTGQRKCENRDDFRNKRLELAGELLEREMRVHIKHAERRMVRAMQRDLYGDRILQSIEHYLDASIITNGLCRAFSTGHWSHPFKRAERTAGVVSTLRRTNPLQMTADLRKTRQQVAYVGKVGDVRFPNPSHWGKLCFLSTPDGENCGLVKNMAITGLVSTNLMEPLMDKLLGCGMEELVDEPSSASWKGKDKVFLNGDWVGVCNDSSSLVADLKSTRRSKGIPPQVEIKRDQQQREVRIFSDAGRILRPLLVVENLKKIKLVKGGYSFQSLLDEGVLELIGVEEEEDCQIAWGIKYLFLGDKGQPPIKYTHCELDLSFLLGLSCGIIPFANHDHARRVLYQSEKHSQQAIGFSTTNPNIRVDTLSHQLYYPQRPLFRTMISDCLGRPEYPLGHNGVLPKPEYFNGQNAIVAVNVHHGYNQEDSLVMNRASLERGMFRTEHIRSYKAEVDNKELWESKRLKLKDRVDFGKAQSKIGRVDSLDDDGFPFIGANLQSGDIVIGRCAESGADHSIKLKHTEKGKVQKVVLTANDDGKNFAVVSLRQVRSPSLGDKFSSMHGQKGVVGLLESQENFPFTRQGIVPDIVINPHAFPTRQTPGQLLESALGKGIACGGSVRYATPFTTPSIDAITDQLHRAGFSRWGSERVYNGQNGEMMRSLIFMGPTFYQRLIHMAEDKVKFRNTGPVHPLTRQPVADRKRFGGVKFGEMERDCLLAHGAAANLHERLFTLSDFSQMHICHKCHNISNVIQRSVPGGGKIRGPYCRFCESAENIVKVNVPYGAKLLCQELFSMGICVKFETEHC